MTDYISRDAALKSLCGEVCNMPDMTCDRIRCIEWNVIHDVPAADVRPVVKAAWKETLFGWECTACGEEQQYARRLKFCPNCGARMVNDDV